MSFTRRHVLTGAIAAPAVIALPRLGWSAPAKMLKISHQFPGGTLTEGDFRDQLCRRFAAELAKKTNGALTADPTWQPLLTTPNHPEYIAGHGTFSGAAATILASVFGDTTSFSATSQSLPGVTRSYTSFSQAALEASMSQ